MFWGYVLDSMIFAFFAKQWEELVRRFCFLRIVEICFLPLAPALLVMLVITKYGANPFSVFPILLYIFEVLVGMGVLET